MHATYKIIIYIILHTTLIAQTADGSISVIGHFPKGEFRDQGVTAGLGLDLNAAIYPIHELGFGLNFGGSIYDRSERSIPFSYYSDLITITERIDNTILHGHMFFKIKPLVIEKIKSEHLIPYLIENICDNAILHHKYISLYVGILKEINSKNKVKMIMKICNKYHSNFFDKKENDINNMSYQELCLKNKNIDNIIGLSLFITYLEKEQIINGLIDNILEPYMDNILIIEDDVEIYKMILSFYNISQIHYKNTKIPDVYVNKLTTLKEKTKSSKIKFKIMDILGE